MFIPHFNANSISEENEVDQEPSYYTYTCRCSGTYLISISQLEEGIGVIQCDGCSERCKVEYEVVEDDELGKGEADIG